MSLSSFSYLHNHCLFLLFHLLSVKLLESLAPEQFQFLIRLLKLSGDLFLIGVILSPDFELLVALVPFSSPPNGVDPT